MPAGGAESGAADRGGEGGGLSAGRWPLLVLLVPAGTTKRRAPLSAKDHGSTRPGSSRVDWLTFAPSIATSVGCNRFDG